MLLGEDFELIFGSVCSGIEAASCAWHPLGWRAAFVSDIEKFPSAVLAHHYPDVPNYGDMTKFKEWPDHAIDLLVGGTPCQSFSVAGLRKGLADPRGNLMLTYLAIADRYRPRWLVWENVPGVLSADGGRAFGTLLGGLGQLGYGFAYRVLDAQHFGVPQRRRRVFVVGYLGDWRRAAAVLFERHSLQGNPPPRRETGKSVAGAITRGAFSGGAGGRPEGAAADHFVAPTLSARTKGGGGLGTDFDLDGGLISHALTSSNTRSGRLDPSGETFIAHSLRAEGFDASEDGTGRGTPLVPVVGTMKSMSSSGGWSNSADHAAAGYMIPVPSFYSITPSNSNKDYNARLTDKAQAVTAGGNRPSARGGDIIAIQERAIAENPNSGPDGVGVRADGIAYTLEARTVPQAIAFPTEMSGTQYASTEEMSPALSVKHTTAVAFQTRIARNGRGQPSEIVPALNGADAGETSDMRPCVATGSAVRRLTPRECERLQGFPDDYTLITYRGKPAADGPRYKALGNSMAVPVMRWIGERIAEVDKIPC